MIKVYFAIVACGRVIKVDAVVAELPHTCKVQQVGVDQAQIGAAGQGGTSRLPSELGPRWNTNLLPRSVVALKKPGRRPTFAWGGRMAQRVKRECVTR